MHSAVETPCKAGVPESAQSVGGTPCRDARMNYYPHHIGDYAKDTRALSQAEHGAYRLLMDEAYSTENGIDADDIYAIACAHTAQERKNTDRVLSKFFTLRDGRYYQKRIEEEVASYRDKSAKASASAKAKWDKRNADVMRTHTERNANASETHAERTCESHAPNNQEPITNNQEPKKVKNKAQAPFDPPDWIPREAWEGWLTMRTKKRTPNTEHALTLAVRDLEKLKALGDDPEEVLNRSTQRGWTGLFPINGQAHAKASSLPPERL
jgi:uncharacterized protein YdaU (DUF1376 family)